MTQDEEHLRLLSIFHYVAGAISAFFSLIFIGHLVFGLVILTPPGGLSSKGVPPPGFLGWFILILPLAFIITGWCLAALMIAAGRCLARRRRYLFCMVVAAIECILMPYGTVLGVFTLIVLMRDSVKRLFSPAPPIQVTPS